MVVRPWLKMTPVKLVVFPVSDAKAALPIAVT